MIYTITGDLGGGKSLFALDMLEKAALAGRPCFSSMGLTDKCPFAPAVAYIGSEDWPVYSYEKRRGYPQFFWEFVCDFPDAFVIIDEADLHLNSEDFKRMPRAVQMFNKFLRKMDIDVVYIVQRLGNLYNRIRDLTGRYYVCENMYRMSRLYRYLDMVVGPEISKRWSAFIRTEFASEKFADPRGQGRMWYGEASRLFPWYFTKEMDPRALEAIRGTWRQERDEDARSRNVVTDSLGARLGDEQRRRRATIAAIAKETMGNADSLGGSGLYGCGVLGEEPESSGSAISAGRRSSASVAAFISSCLDEAGGSLSGSGEAGAGVGPSIERA